MTSLAIKVRTAWALGLLSIWRVVSYRVSVRFGINPVRKVVPGRVEGPFFRKSAMSTPGGLVARRGWYDWHEAFGLRVPQASGTPDWFCNAVSGSVAEGTDRPWWQIPDFDQQLGDIKGVWEKSRFDWVLSCAQHAALGDTHALDRLNSWLEDWTVRNPGYLGPNWKCGQEASIRVIHLAVAAIILDQFHEPESGLVQLVDNHLRRIAPTIRYAIGQDNNHGTSEAAALFIGGSWLERSGHSSGREWQRIGRKWLENRVQYLVLEDGSFSQYSLNYHRVMLDTLCSVEVWRRKLDLQPFSERFYLRARAATGWLGNLVDPGSGDAPNFGANDGARLLPLTDTDYRDYRPTVQLASLLFSECRAFSSEGAWDQPARWLHIDVGRAVFCDWQMPQAYNDGGYAVLRHSGVMAMLHYPRYRFRPGQSHILHLDLWVRGENLLRDGGSYSYNCEPEVEAYFSGVASHNTVQFDNRDQMPRLGRFLYGAWPRAKPAQIVERSGGSLTVSSAYRDWQGAGHERAVGLADNRLEVKDKISGGFKKATLRWRLSPGDWEWNGTVLTNGSVSIEVEATHPLARRELVEGSESRYYSQKTPIPVLEIDVVEPCSITTRVTF